jgi:hypothetical protein
MSTPQDSKADFLKIDSDNLDLDCMEQPRLMRYWCRQLAAAIKKVKDLENESKVLRAEIRTSLREQGARLEKKLTVDAVDDLLFLNPRYQDILRRINEATEQQDLLDANVKGLQSRDYQLSNLNELLKLGYFNAPRVDPQTRDRYLKAKRSYGENTNYEASKALQESQDSKPSPRSTKK